MASHGGLLAYHDTELSRIKNLTQRDAKLLPDNLHANGQAILASETGGAPNKKFF